jgi:hypothetical protein
MTPPRYCEEAVIQVAFLAGVMSLPPPTLPIHVTSSVLTTPTPKMTRAEITQETSDTKIRSVQMV